MKTTTLSYVGALQELLTRLHDTVLGYSKAAELTSQPEFSSFCKRTARERGLLAAELGITIAGLGGEPNFHGSKDARLHRAWLQFSCHVLPETSGQQLVHECQRNEHDLRKRMHRMLAQIEIAPMHLIGAIRRQVALTVNCLETFSHGVRTTDHGRLVLQPQ